jgi:hypothetical protein
MVSLSAALCAALLVAEEWGRHLGKRRLAVDTVEAKAGLGTIEASLFGLLALLVGFTFAGAAARFELRRQQIPQEANALGTAWLRLDLLPEPDRTELRQLFRQYLDSRLRTFDLLPDVDAAQAEMQQTAKLQQRIWDRAVAGVKNTPADSAIIGTMVFPPMNEMFDIASTRTQTMLMHTPWLIYGMLMLVALVCALLAGYEMAGGKRRSLLHMAGFALVTGAALYMILDLEFPRTGMVQLESGDVVLQQLRQSWGD